MGDAPQAAPPGTSPRRRRGALVLFAVLTAAVAGLDQYTKVLATQRLEPYVVYPFLGDVISLQLIFNPGAAFSLATGLTWLLTAVAAVVVIVVVRAARRMRSVGWAIALGMLLGGALGNLIDRLLRDPGFARGEVVDFINYNGWFVGNIADIAIVVAAVLVALLALRGVEIDGTRSGRQPAGEHATATGAPDTQNSEPAAASDYQPDIEAPEGGTTDVAAWARDADTSTEVPGTATEPSAEADEGPSRGGRRR